MEPLFMTYLLRPCCVISVLNNISLPFVSNILISMTPSFVASVSMLMKSLIGFG